MPEIAGAPSARVAISPAFASQTISVWPTSPANSGASQSCSASFFRPGDLGAPGEPAGEADGRAAQDEQAAQRHDERRQAGADHDRAVDVADQAGDGEREQNAQPQRPAPLHRGDRDDHAGGADHRADRQVELAADHQHRGGDRDDAELRRHLEEVDDAGRREQAAVAGDRGEEQEHQNGAGDGAELRSRHQPLEQRRRGHPFVDGGLDRGHATLPTCEGAGPARAGPGVCAQRIPLDARSITWAAFSWVTKPGPVITVPAGIRP